MADVPDDTGAGAATATGDALHVGHIYAQLRASSSADDPHHQQSPPPPESRDKADDDWCGWPAEDARRLNKSAPADQMTGVSLDDVDDGDTSDNDALHTSYHAEDGHDIRQRPQQQQQENQHQQRHQQHHQQEREKIAATVRHAAERIRTSWRTKLRTVYPRRLMRFVSQRRLLPESWLVIEGDKGETWPRVVCTARDNYHRWCKSAAAAVSFVASAVWLITWLIGTPSAVMHDGRTVVNMWAPTYSHVYVLADGGFADWITDHRRTAALPSVMDMHKGYITAEIYGAGEQRNVTFEWLERALQLACKSDGSGETCHCMPAVQLGVLANVVWLGGEDASIAINPVITDRSAERNAIEYDDGTIAIQPTAVIAEFTTRTQQRTRKKFKLYEAFCLTRSLDLLEAPPAPAPPASG